MPQAVIGYSGFLSKSKGPRVSRSNDQGLLFMAVRPGNTYFVDETHGSDTQPNAGGPNTPFATLAAANAAAVDGDTIFITGTVHVSATVVFTQNNLSLIGLNAPSMNGRARISQTGSSVFSPLVHMSGQGCRVENLGTFHGFNDASAQVCWLDDGGRNYYRNVDFLGMGNATAAAQAGGRNLVISGGNGENLFENCRIGLDTIVRATAANASLEINGGSPRNVFRNCVFSSLCSDASDVHILIGAAGIDRFLLLDNCTFINAVDSTGTSLTADISADAAAGGSVLVQGGMSVGSGKISASGPVYVNGAVPTAATSSIGVHAA